MRRTVPFAITAIFIILIQLKTDAQIKINIINSWGYNIIDFENLMGEPYWSANNSPAETQITDDSRFVYKGGIQVLYEIKKNINFGGEVGINRLYYVEDRYSVLLAETEYRWRTYDIWTLNLLAVSQFNLNENIYLESGAGIHNFLNGSGIAAGLMAGIGYEMSLNEKISIPIEFRNDWVFGDATSGIFSLALGIMLNLE